jgi:hypothetical protein
MPASLALRVSACGAQLARALPMAACTRPQGQARTQPRRCRAPRGRTRAAAAGWFFAFMDSSFASPPAPSSASSCSTGTAACGELTTICSTVRKSFVHHRFCCDDVLRLHSAQPEARAQRRYDCLLLRVGGRGEHHLDLGQAPGRSQCPLCAQLRSCRRDMMVVRYLLRLPAMASRAAPPGTRAARSCHIVGRNGSVNFTLSS